MIVVKAFPDFAALYPGYVLPHYPLSLRERVGERE
jgi:hypothetical protein